MRSKQNKQSKQKKEDVRKGKQSKVCHKKEERGKEGRRRGKRKERINAWGNYIRSKFNSFPTRTYERVIRECCNELVVVKIILKGQLTKSYDNTKFKD